MFESERRTRIIESGRTAQDIAAGKIPEGVVPTAEVDKISMEGTTAGTVQMGAAPTVDAVKVEPTAAEKVATMDATTAKTPEQIQAAQMTASKITDKPDVQAAIGELSPEAVAKVQEISELSKKQIFIQDLKF